MDASDAILKTLDSLNSQLKANHIAIAGQLKIIDTRLALIEQRLTNMEAFVPVDNTPHIYQHT